MGKPKVPNSKGATDRLKKMPGTESEEEPISPEANAKMDKKFKTSEEIPLKRKKSVPIDSTAQRGETPISTSKEEKKKRGEK